MKSHFEIGETAVTVISDEEYISVAEQAIFEARERILRKISEDPFFMTTYDPYPVSEDDDELIKRMCDASKLADVGPMAGVAGAVAVFAVEKMSEAGAPYAIVENGGDIAMKIDRDVTVGVFQDDERFKELAFRIKYGYRFKRSAALKCHIADIYDSFGNDHVFQRIAV